LWQADFEPPEYAVGAVVGQQGWAAFSGSYGSDGQVVNSVPGDGVPQGSQCLRLPPPGVGNYVMVRTKDLTNELAAVDLSNEFVKISYKMRPDTTYDAIDIRSPGGTRMILFAVYPAGLQIAVPATSATIPCSYSNWHDVFITLDPLNNKVVQFGLDGQATAVSTVFDAGTTWPLGYLRLSSQVNSPAVGGSGTAQCYFDDMRITSLPAGPIIGPSPSSIFIGTFTRSGAARIVNSGRPGSYTWSASSPNAWLTLDPAFTNGSSSASSVDIPFTVDKSMLSGGDTNGTLVVNCGTYGTLTYSITVRKGTPPAALVNIAGLHLTQVNPNASQEKYYQDTMIKDLVPHAAFDGGMMDVGVLRGFYCFGNTAFTNDPYLGPLLVDGPAQTVVKGAFFTSNTVYALDPNVYPVQNPAVDNGSAPGIAGTLADFISAANLRKQELNMPLYPGTNHFTLLAPAAGEIGTEGMLGLFVYGSNAAPDFADGQLPTLAAVDDGTGNIEAEGFNSCGYHGADVTYFQKATEILTGTTVAKEINGYVVRITYFNVIGRNDVDVNPYGMTPPGCVGHVCPYFYDQWAIRGGGDHAVAYLELVVSQPPPVPAAPVSNIVVGVWETSGVARVYNNGTSNFGYTASVDAPWLSIAAGFQAGVVTQYRDIPLRINRTGLSNGFYTGHLTVNCGPLDPPQLVYNVRLRVGTSGVLNVYGLHVTEISPDVSYNKLYEDTMFGEQIPYAAFNANIDVGIVAGTWCFGNYDLTNQALWLAGLLTDGPAQYVAKGSFQPASTNVPDAVNALDLGAYPLLNPVTDNATAPVISGSLADYINARQLTKNQLYLPLQEGLNRFTILLGPLGEIEDQGMLGLFIGTPQQGPNFSPGVLPTVAGIDENGGGVVDANGFESCGYIAGDAGYTQKATNYFATGTLTNQIGDYLVMLTQFDLVGPDAVNQPFGLTGPNCVGNVCEYLEPDFNSQWAIRPAGGQYLGYVEVQVELIPEPALLGGLLLAAWLLRRATQQ